MPQFRDDGEIDGEGVRSEVANELLATAKRKVEPVKVGASETGSYITRDQVRQVREAIHSHNVGAVARLLDR
tara:strand:+ start:330 stop:545 length:216 start_codon:yes stop_codon:yes gene_type:complete